MAVGTPTPTPTSTPAPSPPPTRSGPTTGDAFGLMLREAWARHVDGRLLARSLFQLVERDDGLLMVGPAKFYFAEPRGWIDCERAVLGRFSGRVLDIGARAGRLPLPPPGPRRPAPA